LSIQPPHYPDSVSSPRARKAGLAVWWWRVAIAAASIAIVAANVWLWNARSWTVAPPRASEVDESGARQALIERVGPQRTLEARLTGFAWGARPPVLRSESATSRRPSAVLAAAGLALQQTERGETAGADRVAGLAYLLVGEYERAVERLEESRQSMPAPSASVLSDLAAAYLERGRLHDRAADVAKGADWACRAVTVSDAPLAAWFNRALALEQLGLRDRAIAAWTDYLTRAAVVERTREASEPQWAEEARQRRRALEASRPTTIWLSERELLVSGAAFARDGEVARLGAAWPAGVREYVQDVLLPAWGQATLDGDAPAADVALNRARRLAAVTGGEENQRILTAMVDRVSHFARASSRAARTRLAGGLVAYGEGRRLYEANDVIRASASFTQATLGLNDLPALASWSRLHDAIGFYLTSDFAEMRRLLAQIVEEASAHGDFALRGRSQRLQGVTAARLGRFSDAFDLDLAAHGDYLRALDREEAAGMEAAIAEVAELSGRLGEAWRWQLRAIRHADVLTKVRRKAGVFAGTVWASTRQGYFSLASEFQLELVERSLHPADQADPVASVEALLLGARLLREAGRVDDARRQAAAGRSALARVPDPQYRARLDLELEIVDALLSDTADSLVRLTHAIERTNALGSDARAPELFLARSRFFTRERRFAEARRDLELGLNVVAEHRALQATRRMRVGVKDYRRELLAELIDVTAQLDPSGRLSWESAERYRAEEVYSSAPANDRPALALEAVMQSLSIDRDVVQFAETTTHVYRWHFRRDRRLRFDVLRFPPDEIASLTARWLRAVAAERNGDGYAVKLHAVLLGGLDLAGDPTRGRDLVVVPDGSLHRLPFAALRSGNSAGTLGSISTIQFALSSRLLNSGTRPRPRKMIAFASANAGGGPPLPSAVAEAEHVFEQYSAGRVHRGDESTWAAFESALNEADVVHVAAHASAGSEDRSPTLALSGQASGESAKPLNAEPRVRTVVLSACSTAAGLAFASEGPLSMTQDLLARGVSDVIGTLWPVDDDEARQFMILLHKELSLGSTPAIAVRATQLAFMKRGAPPRAWMPYVVYSR
jgi:hypothetical protein